MADQDTVTSENNSKMADDENNFKKGLVLSGSLRKDWLASKNLSFKYTYIVLPQLTFN